MNIVYTIDQGFYYQLYVSIKSMILNSTENFNIYIVINDLEDNKKIQLKKMCNLSKYNIKIMFLFSINFNNFGLRNDRGSISQYYRLFLDDIFQYNNININDIGKILYLDADTMLVNDIKNILNVNLNEYPLGACLDAWSPYYRKLFNLNKNTPMLNSGVLLIDLVKWKKQNISKKIINLIKNRNGFFNQGDQGILNEFFKGHFKVLSMKYNFNSVDIELNYDDILLYRKPVSFYELNDYQCSKNNPIVIHFISSFLLNRPWQYKNNSYYGNFWRKYCLPIKIFNDLNERKSFLLFIYNKFNKSISIRLLGIMQAYIRPLILRVKKWCCKL